MNETTATPLHPAEGGTFRRLANGDLERVEDSTEVGPGKSEAKAAAEATTASRPRRSPPRADGSSTAT